MRIQAKWERATESKGDNTTAWEKLLPTFDFSFRADRADSKPSSAVQSPPICARSFFSFFPFHPNLSAATSSSSPPPPRLALTQAISRRRHLDTATTAPTVAATTAATSPFAGSQAPAGLAHTRRGHTQATPPPSPSLCLVHLKKASDQSFPLFSPFVFNGAGHPLDTGPLHSPWHASTHPTSPRAHAGRPFAVVVATTTTTSMPLRPAPLPRPRRPTTSVTRPRHTNRGCKRCAGPHHFRDTPICSPPPSRPAPPAVLPCIPGGVGGTARP